MNTNNTVKNRIIYTIEENDSSNKNGIYEIKSGCNATTIDQKGCKLKKSKPKKFMTGLYYYITVA